MTNTDTEDIPFEESLKQLSEIVNKLESEDVSLEDSISLFEKGMKLSKICSTTLENAELKLEQVNKRISDL